MLNNTKNKITFFTINKFAIIESRIPTKNNTELKPVFLSWKLNTYKTCKPATTQITTFIAVWSQEYGMIRFKTTPIKVANIKGTSIA